VEGFDGLVKIMGMQWDEREAADTFPVVSEAKCTPSLVLQQLDEDGERNDGKVIVDEKLPSASAPSKPIAAPCRDAVDLS
jgi:hypothetical protein